MQYNHDASAMTLKPIMDLPKALIPESPGYALNSHANFYFMDNMSQVYRFNKMNKCWSQIEFNMSVF